MDVRHNITKANITVKSSLFSPARILDNVCFTEAIHVTTASDSASTHSSAPKQQLLLAEEP